jgi:hypothetical protein
MTMKREIGGFFELELNISGEYHPDAIKVNTGRNALEYVLKARKLNFLYLPYYICDSMLEPLLRNGISFKYYHIDENFNPTITLPIKSKEALLYINYFGINDVGIKQVSQQFNNVIVDNSQAFFSFPLKSTDTIYSARKFFGVPDGGYVYTSAKINDIFERDKSYGRLDHLLRRIDCDATSSYKLFLRNEELLSNQPIKRMSVLTERILASIDYQDVLYKRKRNFVILHEKLSKMNELNVDSNEIAAPMVYPLLVSKEGLRDYLIKNRIYVATYWNEVLTRVASNSLEAKLTRYLAPLPIDQRYGIDEMEHIASKIYLWMDNNNTKGLA